MSFESSPPARPVQAVTTPMLQGSALVAAGLVLAIANFLVVLDTTIANVSVANIAGALAVSPSQGTWVITSYSVAEAITVPLTGWLAGRFGSVKVFVASMLGFGLFSFLCGTATSLPMLVMFRVLQGLCGGPLIPLSQTLLLRVFPPKLAPAATGIWAMTTLVAPILGPIMGGFLCDNVGWSFIFWINVPIALLCGWAAWRLLGKFDATTARQRVDVVGLGLLVVWVGALQVLLDLGKDADWFASPLIVTLAIVAAIGFVVFLIWELTEAHPIVDVRVFRHRGYAASVLTLCVGFGSFFAANVLLPLWLQQYMGYTASWAGYVSALLGITAVICAPFVANLSGKVDARLLVSLGLGWMALITFFRGQADTDLNYFGIGHWLLLQGFGMPLFFVPLTTLALASVQPAETASAAGLMSFCRTLSGAFATSIVQTVWENGATHFRADLVGSVSGTDTLSALDTAGLNAQAALGSIDRLVQNQSVMLSTNAVFLGVTLLFAASATIVWFVPKPTRKVDAGMAH